MQPTRGFTFSCLVLVVLIALSGYAFSATVAVGTCTTLVHFATIQLAVNSVPAGSIIKVCPGTYHEQVAIIDKNAFQRVVRLGNLSTCRPPQVTLPL